MSLRKYCVCWKFSAVSSESSERNSKSSSRDREGTSGKEHSLSREEIKKITKDFELEIGRGGFSTVYMGLWTDGRPCVVKVIEHRSKRARTEFKREFQALSRLSHPNIVSLLAFYADSDARMLVLEHFSNGSLYENLQNQCRKGTPNKKKKRKVLSWKQRKLIAVQIASALEYLHETCDPPLIHRDLKSSNVLLDEELNARLCDFGSSATENSEEEEKEEEKRSHGGMHVMGSPGYLDPFYFKTGTPSKSGDIYSFGVLLAEMLTALEAFSDDRNPKLLSAFVGPFLRDPDKCLGIVDERLRGQFDEREAQELGTLAAQCMSEDPLSRPPITQLVCNLRSLL